ncbi:flagellar biosynthetic protein FliO [Polymorphobacter sp.]|uniref:flagellar biosynthetic protein FliO n=1 Tax=Polymorphobacter sp. TaxID=1909290 RepID=UPI003F72D492
MQLARLRALLGGGLKSLALAGEARRHARVLQALPLGPGSRLLVVEFGGRRHLIGQARTGLVSLADAPAEPDA